MFETEKAWITKEVALVKSEIEGIPTLTEKVAAVTVAAVTVEAEKLVVDDEKVIVTLIKEHTHAGVELKIGDEIITYLQQARWLQNMQIAVIKSTQE